LFTVAAYALLFGVKYSPKTYISLLPLTIGVMLACTFDVSASNVFGLMSAFGSALIFVSSNIFFKKIMPTPNSGGAGPAHKLDKINLLFYSSGIAFLMMIPIWLYYDLTPLLNRWSAGSIVAVNKHANSGGHSLVYYFFANGTVHFTQNIIAFAILATTSPVTYSIASLIKRIAVICIAIVWFTQKMHPAQGFGICLTFVGLWMYNQAKGDVERGEKQVRRVEATREMILPSTKDEVRMLDETATPGVIEERQPLYPLRPTHLHHLSGVHLPPLNIELAHAAFTSKHNTIISAGIDQAYPYPSPPRSIDSPPPESTNLVHPVGHSNAADIVDYRTLANRRTVSNNLEGVPLLGPK
jgi:solute carrier family 35, member E1